MKTAKAAGPAGGRKVHVGPKGGKYVIKGGRKCYL
jgi:hypothetical protein